MGCWRYGSWWPQGGAAGGGSSRRALGEKQGAVVDCTGGGRETNPEGPVVKKKSRRTRSERGLSWTVVKKSQSVLVIRFK